MCDFDLENLNNEVAIEKAKKVLDDEKVIGSKKNNRNVTFITRYIVMGIIIFIIVVIFAEFEILMGSHEWTMFFFVIILPCFLLVGLIAGVIQGIKFLLSRLKTK